MSTLSIPSKIQELIKESENYRSAGEVKYSLLLLDQVCLELKNIHDWDHIEQFAKEGLITSRDAGYLDEEGNFSNWLVLFAAYKHDVSLVKDFINDFISVKYRQIDRIKKQQPVNQNDDHDNPQIKFLEKSIADHIRILDDIEMGVFQWPKTII